MFDFVSIGGSQKQDVCLGSFFIELKRIRKAKYFRLR